MASKPKAIAPTGDTLPIDLPAPEISEDLAQDPNIAPLLEPPAVPPSILQSAIEQQERELAELEYRMTLLSEQYAQRARDIVARGLETGRRKAHDRILNIDLADFFGDGGSLPPPIETFPALPQSPEEDAA